MNISNYSRNDEEWTKLGAYKQGAEKKLNLNPVFLYGEKEARAKTQTEHSRWDCRNITSTLDAGLC